LTDVFKEYMRYETHANMLKSLIETQTNYTVDSTTYKFIQSEGALLIECEERILLSLKELRAKVPEHR
jgi:hypothetical protein